MPTEHKDATSVWQVLRFTLFSISAGLIQIAAFTLMETVFHLPYWPSYLTALVLSVQRLLPYMLAFAAGAMIYVVVAELIPESQSNERSGIMAIATLVGFSVMMVLDVALG